MKLLKMTKYNIEERLSKWYLIQEVKLKILIKLFINFFQNCNCSKIEEIKIYLLKEKLIY